MGSLNEKWDTPEWRKQRNKNLNDWFLGNQDAVQCFVMISSAAETWDDLADGDVEVSKQRLDGAFTDLFLRLTGNPFFQAYHAEIRPILAVAINAWQDSEELRQGSRTERHWAFVLRNLGLELIPLFAWLLGGYEHMRRVSQEARQFFMHETYAEWEQE